MIVMPMRVAMPFLVVMIVTRFMSMRMTMMNIANLRGVMTMFFTLFTRMAMSMATMRMRMSLRHASIKTIQRAYPETNMMRMTTHREHAKQIHRQSNRTNQKQLRRIHLWWIQPIQSTFISIDSSSI
jgi:hypothetical protein